MFTTANQETFVETATRSQANDDGVPARVYPYTAGIVGGLLGGLVMAIPAAAYGLVSGYELWLPFNLAAGVFMTNLQSITPRQPVVFDPFAFGVGLSIHLTLAMLLGLLFTMLLPTLPGRPVLWSLVIGPLLWSAVMLVVLPSFNPVMAQWLDWPSFVVANLAYALVLGLWIAATPKVSAEDHSWLHLYGPWSAPDESDRATFSDTD